MKKVAAVFLVFAFLVLPAFADDLVIKPGDTLKGVLATYKGKTVTIQLSSGQEMTGVVRDVTDSLVHLGSLAGKEYYDAAVSLDAVRAVVVRTKK